MLSLRLSIVSEKLRAGFAIEAGGIRSQERKCVNWCSFFAAQKLDPTEHALQHLSLHHLHIPEQTIPKIPIQNKDHKIPVILHAAGSLQ